MTRACALHRVCYHSIKHVFPRISQLSAATTMSRLFFQPTHTRLGVNRFRLYPSTPRDLFSHRALFSSGGNFSSHAHGTRLLRVRQYFESAAVGGEFPHFSALSCMQHYPLTDGWGAQIIDIGTPLDIESAAKANTQFSEQTY